MVLDRGSWPASLLVLAAAAVLGGCGGLHTSVRVGADEDGDGFEAVEAGGDDCDDGDAEVHPGSVEGPCSGRDLDCDGRAPGDLDGDGALSLECGGDDCDDGDPAAHPGADEAYCATEDLDCDGVVPADVDGDGARRVSCGGDDCDDLNASTYPGAPEDGFVPVDLDCDGVPADAHECPAEAATRCVAATVETCSRGADGCLQWGATADCSESGLVCVEESGEARCVGCDGGVLEGDVEVFDAASLARLAGVTEVTGSIRSRASSSKGSRP